MRGKGTGGKMLGVGHQGWDTTQGMGFQTGDGFPVRGGVSDKGWGSR